jgi:hypothetical protein
MVKSQCGGSGYGCSIRAYQKICRTGETFSGKHAIIAAVQPTDWRDRTTESARRVESDPNFMGHHRKFTPFLKIVVRQMKKIKTLP